jgi:hypothetical protein
LHLRDRSALAIAAEVAACVGVAQTGDAHIVDKAGRLAELFPLANARFLLLPVQPLFRSEDG